MRLHMDLQRNLVVIALSAICTAVRSHAFVNVVVFGQIKFGLESLRTLGTLYRPRIGVRASDMLHHVGLANKFGVADDACVLLDPEMRFYVHRAFISALVKLAAELARVTVLRTVHHVLHVVVHFNLLAVNLEELLRILRCLQLLFQLRQIFELRRRTTAVLCGCPAENTADDAIYLDAVVVLQQTYDRRVDKTIALIGKDSRSRCRDVVILLLTQLHRKTDILGIVAPISRLLYGNLDVGGTRNDR